MTTENVPLSATEAMRRWRELSLVSERGKILIDFIETHRDGFETLKVQNRDHNSGELTTMVRMKSPYEWTYFYHGGVFYVTTRQRSMESRTNKGPIIVGILTGKELDVLVNDEHFAKAMLD